MDYDFLWRMFYLPIQAFFPQAWLVTIVELLISISHKVFNASIWLQKLFENVFFEGDKLFSWLGFHLVCICRIACILQQYFLK